MFHVKQPLVIDRTSEGLRRPAAVSVQVRVAVSGVRRSLWTATRWWRRRRQALRRAVEQDLRLGLQIATPVVGRPGAVSRPEHVRLRSGVRRWVGPAFILVDALHVKSGRASRRRPDYPYSFAEQGEGPRSIAASVVGPGARADLGVQMSADARGSTSAKGFDVQGYVCSHAVRGFT